MVRFSSRVPSDLRSNRLAEARARLGPVAYDLTVSNPTLCGLDYPRDLLEALADPAALVYRPDPRGMEGARRAVAALYRQWRVEVPCDRVLLTASTSDAYGYLARLLAEPGERIAVPTPSYPLFEQLLRLDGIVTTPYRLDGEHGWRLDPDALRELPEDCRALVAVHPNNPTGSFVEPDDADRVVEECRARGMALIVDEVFLPFPMAAGRGSDHSFAGTRGCLTFSLGGLSKSVGLPQLKLAWIVVSGPHVDAEAALERLEYIADAYLAVGTPVAIAAPTLLTRGQQVQRAILERCRSNLDRLRALAARSAPVCLHEPAGGWSAVLRFPAVIAEEELAIRLLEHDGVAVYPGFLFDFERDGYLVISLLPTAEVFAAGVQRLLAAVDRLIG